jgi:hypothetical protein
MRVAFSMIMRSTFLLITLLLSSSVITSRALGQESTRNQSGWRATVECDSVVVYAQMSKQSRVVGHLKKGDAVTIDLEFISAGGAWCSVTELGKRVRLGYVNSECLERKQTESVTVWQAQLPPRVMMPGPEPAQRTDVTAEKHPTREEIEQEVDRVVASRLKALQLANENPVQMVQREPFGFVDGTSFVFLPRLGVPFNFFHHIPPRINPSVQIRPSHISRRR